MQALHGAGKVHRDLKPANVVRMPADHMWYLIDLGCTAAIGVLVSDARALSVRARRLARQLMALRALATLCTCLHVWLDRQLKSCTQIL